MIPINILTSTAVPLAAAQHRHGPDHPQAVPQAHRAHRLRRLPLLRLAPHPGRPRRTASPTHPSSSTTPPTPARRSSSPNATSAAAAPASTPPGRSTSTASSPSSPPPSPTSSSPTPARTASSSSASAKRTSKPSSPAAPRTRPQTHHQPRSPNRHRRPRLQRPLRHRPVPQILPAQRPRRHRPHPPPRRALDTFESAHDKEFWSTPKLATTSLNAMHDNRFEGRFVPATALAASPRSLSVNRPRTAARSSTTKTAVSSAKCAKHSMASRHFSTTSGKAASTSMTLSSSTGQSLSRRVDRRRLASRSIASFAKRLRDYKPACHRVSCSVRYETDGRSRAMQRERDFDTNRSAHPIPASVTQPRFHTAMAEIIPQLPVARSNTEGKS